MHSNTETKQLKTHPNHDSVACCHDSDSVIQCIQWCDNSVRLLDQTKLPFEETYIICGSYQEVIDAIKTLKIRGAPALGIAGAYGAVLAAQEGTAIDHSAKSLSISLSGATKQSVFFESATLELCNARPTAANLAWGVKQITDIWCHHDHKLDTKVISMMVDRALAIHREDIAANRKIAEAGASLLKPGNILTHCNTGDLATGGIGTAFGVLREGYRRKIIQHVFSCETRPILQGLRLTAWELELNRIPFTVICDNMAGTVMKNFPVTAVIVGADRITRNGDVANKVGTYQLAVLAKYHGIDFFVAAPRSTFDLSLESSKDIPIESRDGVEITGILTIPAGKNACSFPTYNPAFDITPNELVTAIICEKGVLKPPYCHTISTMLL